MAGKTSGNLLTKEDALQAMEKFCAYSERCEYDVMLKLKKIPLKPAEQQWVIKQLRQENFIDDERYSKNFCKGKFRSNKWGRVKIRAELRMKKLPSQIIEEGLSAISEEDYRQTLRQLIDKKQKEYKTENQFERNSKVSRYVIGKGFEPSLVMEFLSLDQHFSPND